MLVCIDIFFFVCYNFVLKCGGVTSLGTCKMFFFWICVSLVCALSFFSFSLSFCLSLTFTFAGRSDDWLCHLSIIGEESIGHPL